jgi:hypothetical protein
MTSQYVLYKVQYKCTCCVQTSVSVLLCTLQVMKSDVRCVMYVRTMNEYARKAESDVWTRYKFITLQFYTVLYTVLIVTYCILTIIYYNNDSNSM